MSVKGENPLKKIYSKKILGNVEYPANLGILEEEINASYTKGNIKYDKMAAECAGRRDQRSQMCKRKKKGRGQ